MPFMRDRREQRKEKRSSCAGRLCSVPSSLFSVSAPERGTVLLMALIVMTGVVISSVGMGSLILSSLQRTRVIDNAGVAYYAAESGVEEALFLARRSTALPAAVG